MCRNLHKDHCHIRSQSFSRRGDKDDPTNAYIYVEESEDAVNEEVGTTAT